MIASVGACSIGNTEIIHAMRKTRKVLLEEIRGHYLKTDNKSEIGDLIESHTGRDPSFSRWQFYAYVYNQVRLTRNEYGRRILHAETSEECRCVLEELRRMGKWHSYSDDSYIPKPTHEELERAASEREEIRNKELERSGQIWHYRDGNLIAIHQKFKEIGDQQLAEACGYFKVEADGTKTVLVKNLMSALEEASHLTPEDGDYEQYFMINGRIAVQDSNRFGPIYVAKRLVDEFYPDHPFTPVEDEDDDNSFDEDMMEMEGYALNYLDADEPLEDKDELICFGLDPQHVDPLSHWHDD